MNAAKKFLHKGYPEWTVVVAKTQTRGRGQFGRKWISPKGGLYFSVILKPKFATNDVSKLTLIGTMSIAKVLNNLFGLPAKVKWPNDILIKNRKISGVLIESEIKSNKLIWAVIGAGINVNTDMEGLKDSKIICTSIKNELKITVDENILLKEVLSEMKKCYLLINKKLPT
ncbi:MAG: biotin--[acetyl-CoA-carboxylase] ligase [Elusimicrobia bacterium RIFOXYA2_FULL_40_6]|nr:MAG: biotin--[acetyl-CoA-carboxylase] ligase [Elusimicrobia bacterium RIFOXYA2_FULL_40_6]